MSATVVAIGENAEGQFIADTRRDWITGFAYVNTYIKKMISAAIASKAAIEIVDYDTRNFPTRLAAEMKIDLLTDNYNRAVELLSKLDFNSIRSVT